MVDPALAAMIAVGFVVVGALMFVVLQGVDLGLNPDNILVARLPLPRGQYDSAADKQRFFQTLLPRLHRLPGVLAATETTSLPPYGGIGTEIDVIGKTPAERWDAMFQLVSEGYFPTLGLRLIRGRTLSAEIGHVRRLYDDILRERYDRPEPRLSDLDQLPV